MFSLFLNGNLLDRHEDFFLMWAYYQATQETLGYTRNTETAASVQKITEFKLVWHEALLVEEALQEGDVGSLALWYMP